MADQDVIKEFLVKLGFKVGPDWHQATKVIDEVTATVEQLGISIDLSMAALAAFTVKAADSLDKLYFASQRTGSTVGNIQAFDYAMSQTGSSAAGAQAALENIGHFVRSYPGAIGFLEKMGVAPGHVRDATATMGDLAKTFQKMPFWQAQPYANMLGIDENTLLSMQRGDFNKYLDEYTQRLKTAGVNSDIAAVKGHELMNSIRGIEAEAAVAGAALVSGPFGQGLQWVARTIEDIIQGMALIFKDPKSSMAGLWAADKRGALGYAEDVVKTIPNTAYPTAVLAARLHNATGAPGGTAWDTATAFFQRQGWTSAQATGIAANLFRESGFNPRATNPMNGMYGLAQWDTARRERFKRWAHKDIHGASAAEQLAFIQAELNGPENAAAAKLRAAKDAPMAAQVFSDAYERTGSIEEARLRGNIAASAPSITQNTKIEVFAKDGVDLTNKIVAKQNDVNSQLVRNVKGAIR